MRGINISIAAAAAASNQLIIPQPSENYLMDLQARLDYAQRNQTEDFADFSDLDIIQWFLYSSKHLDITRDRSARSTAAYKRELEQFCTYITTYSMEIGIDIKEIKKGSLFKSLLPYHIRLYQEWLVSQSPYVKKNSKSYSMATLERKNTILKMFFKFLYEANYTNEPLYKDMKVARVTDHDRPNRDMYSSDVVRVLDAFIKTENAFMFILVQVFVTTGMRNEELCTLKVSDLKNEAHEEGYFLDVLGKGNKRRQIPIKEKVYRSIEMFRELRGLPTIAESNPDAPLFTNSKGNLYTPSYLVKVFNKEFQKISPLLRANLKYTPHVFRHAFAIISHENKVDIFDIMKALGHAKIETTTIYLEKVIEREKHAIHKWRADSLGNFI